MSLSMHYYFAVHYYCWCWCYYYHRTRRGRRAGRALTSGDGVRVPEPGPPLWRPHPVPSLKRNCTHLHRYRVSKMEFQRCLAHHWVHALETAEILPTRPSHQSDLTSTSTIYILKLMWTFICHIDNLYCEIQGKFMLCTTGYNLKIFSCG